MVPFSRRSMLLGGAAALLSVSRAASAGMMPAHGLAGLEHPVEIDEDRRGVPHVRARTIPDAYFANGYLIARDRLWELDLGYRRSIGRMAEVFGPDFVEGDTAARLFLFRGDAAAELARFSPVVQASARAYVAGINAFIARLRRDPSGLPPEFRLLDYAPLEWDVLDLIRMRAEATGNTEGEIRRCLLAARGGLAYDTITTPIQPAHALRPPEGLDVRAVSRDDLGLFGVLQNPPGLSGIAVPGGENAHRKHNEGSNAWVIAPSRTRSGRPILANDPHLGFGVPGPRYVIHLTAPGLDVIGGASAGMPGIMQGHNAHIAFGRTNFHIDQEDLFILSLDPSDPDRYAHGGGWKAMETVETVIPVRGEAARTVTLRYAAQGPVVSYFSEKGRATAVSATWLAPGANGLLANIGINLATDWKSFVEALRVHTSPTNFLYADVKGNIGWHAAGGLPARAEGHDGLMPAPGDGRYDWKGLQPLENLPSVLNPPQGYFGSSNEMNLPPGYPVEERRVSFEWRDAFRHERVVSVLEATPKATVADCAALQHDVLSLPALRCVNLLPDMDDLAAEQALLRSWDRRVAADSAGAALYELWWSHMERLVHDALIPETFRDLLPGPVSATLQLALLEGADGRLGDRREAILTGAFRAAVAEARKRMGPLPAAWRWGRLHTITVRHPLGRSAAAFPPVGGETTQSGGDGFTVMARWYNPLSHRENPYAATGGASYLMVCDVGDWDRSLFLNFPGQSGDPASPHYADFLPVWLAGEMQNLPFSREAVRRSARHSFTLLP